MALNVDLAARSITDPSLATEQDGKHWLDAAGYAALIASSVLFSSGVEQISFSTCDVALVQSSA